MTVQAATRMLLDAIKEVGQEIADQVPPQPVFPKFVHNPWVTAS
jgi:hypothetical protein